MAANGEPRYEFGFRPEPGEVIDIAPGIRWLRLALPFVLEHINVWLLRDGPGWALVDTGLFTSTTREVWKHVLEHELDGEPLTRVLVTHLHPDHLGCAGWLAHTFGIDLWMSRDEYLLARVLVADTGKPAPPEGIRFYRGAGFTQEQLDRYVENFGAFGRVVSPMPESYRRLREGMTLEIGERRWEVVVGRGHSPEHSCLYCREDDLLISGDQILPTISSNVSVWPTEPAANPLAYWFESIDKLSAFLPAETLVLPAHGKPFRGALPRLSQLREEHETGLGKLHRMCAEPRRAVDVFPALFKARITRSNLIMATGEAISHLNYLVAAGELDVETGDDGVNWYRQRQ